MDVGKVYSRSCTSYFDDADSNHSVYYWYYLCNKFSNNYNRSGNHWLDGIQQLKENIMKILINDVRVDPQFAEETIMTFDSFAEFIEFVRQFGDVIISEVRSETNADLEITLPNYIDY